MDNLVFNKLTEWGLSEWMQNFEDEGINEESFFCLDDQDIANLIPKVGPRAIFKTRLNLLKEEQKTNQERVDSSVQVYTVSYNQCKQEHEDESQSAQLHPSHQSCHSAAKENRALTQTMVWPSTSGTSDKARKKNNLIPKKHGKRKSDLQGESSNWQSPTKKPRHDTTLGSYTGNGRFSLAGRDMLKSYHNTSNRNIILSRVKDIMRCVHRRLPHQDNKLNKFLKDKISDLETDKRELVGVFGKTGAGKSSLINAVIGEKNLLPSGSINACTTVMIKVEANMQNSKYEADIEFITKEEWKDELWSMFNFLGDNADHESVQVDDDDDTDKKLSALYGEEWRNKSPEELMNGKYFREIPEFLNSRRKILTCESGKELSARCVKYTRTDSQDGGVKRWYWPLVKCVTVRVPNNDFLQHVTLVDLPGNGDRNKSRDKMWKEVVGRCSTVWIATDINRAVSEKEPWEILETASSFMGNGGECQQIHFICTKSDHIEDLDDHSAAGVRALIFKRNMRAKEEVSKEFSKLKKIKKHFSEDCFKVFTVSSKEFFKKKRLNSEETEIPKLQEFLQNLNDCHSEALNYVSGAHGILSLIQGARCRDVANQKTVSADLEEKMRHELDKVRKPILTAYKAFEKRLGKGVEKSKQSCEGDTRSVLFPRGVSGCGFHRTLRCVVQNSGAYKTKKGKQINLNMKLASRLTDSIDEEFRKTFPNERKAGPFNGAISRFSLDTEKLIGKYKDVKLQLIFLRTEEKNVKEKLSKTIREYKKEIYNNITATIEENMQECYERAAGFKGKGSLKNMRDTIEKHVHDSKNIMFEQAKDAMLGQLRCLKKYILKTMEETMQRSVELSLKTDSDSLPDVTNELAMVKKSYNELVGTPDDKHHENIC